ncbi:hypothetical protein C8R44DRAFT_330014 [Mycena epipterygia]|nr:hypothetical protein C8R44DRAFT_330014 [Mycena epipterygia]
MDAEQKGDSPKPTAVAIDPDDEAAATKIWAVYVGEAEKYDKALVESWKSDMEGILIFAGLFSASLTAFLIESYKTLNRDSGDVTVQLLSQISQQLAASADGSIFSIPTAPPSSFTPSPSSLVCNALWFLSLGLSLTCALVATLLEQWARDFLHRSEIRSAPVIRARIFSFLYYGLKRFNMHMVVEVIPLLLHASLIFFFAGLVAFLIPVNIAMTVVAAAILALVAGVYCILTFLPLRYLDSPYRTPLSGIFWRLSRHVEILWHRRHSDLESGAKADPTKDETVVEAISRQAMAPSDQRAARDERALIWTVKSLSDDEELEPFVEAIPDILWGPGWRREVYSDHFRALVHNPDVHLYGRIQGLLDSCEADLLSLEVQKRRQIACYKAMWAVATLFESHILEFPPSPPSFYVDDLDVSHYASSACALMRYNEFKPIHSRLTDLGASLITQHNQLDLAPVISYLGSLRHEGNYQWIIDHDATVKAYLDDPQGKPALVMVAKFSKIIAQLSTEIPHQIIFDYMSEAAQLNSLPYHWIETIRLMRPLQYDFSHVKESLERSLDTVVSIQLRKLNTKELEWADEITRRLCSFWRPDDPTVPIPWVSYYI